MGIYSTQNISREDVIRQITEKITKELIFISSKTDKELEDLMFDYFGNERLENYRIVKKEIKQAIEV